MSERGKFKNKESYPRLSYNDPDLMQLKVFYDNLKLKYSQNDLYHFLEGEYSIPADLFTDKLGSLETISKYLVENCGLSLGRVAKLTKRSNKNIWYSYNESKEKFSKKFQVKKIGIIIPIKIISDLRLSVLENIVAYLKNTHGLTYKEISVIIKRDERTIWTTYQNARQKSKNKKL